MSRAITTSEGRLHRLHRPVLIDRIVYATITIMSVLIIYDGWEHLKLINVVGVILGPVLAMFLAHVFSAAMAQHVEVGRVLSRKEWGGIARIQAPFLLLCVPPLAVVSSSMPSTFPSLKPFGSRSGLGQLHSATGDLWRADVGGSWVGDCSASSSQGC